MTEREHPVTAPGSVEDHLRETLASLEAAVAVAELGGQLPENTGEYLDAISKRLAGFTVESAGVSIEKTGPSESQAKKVGDRAVRAAAESTEDKDLTPEVDPRTKLHIKFLSRVFGDKVQDLPLEDLSALANRLFDHYLTLKIHKVNGEKQLERIAQARAQLAGETLADIAGRYGMDSSGLSAALINMTKGIIDRTSDEQLEILIRGEAPSVAAVPATDSPVQIPAPAAAPKAPAAKVETPAPRPKLDIKVFKSQGGFFKINGVKHELYGNQEIKLMNAMVAADTDFSVIEVAKLISESGRASAKTIEEAEALLLDLYKRCIVNETSEEGQYAYHINPNVTEEIAAKTLLEVNKMVVYVDTFDRSLLALVANSDQPLDLSAIVDACAPAADPNSPTLGEVLRTLNKYLVLNKCMTKTKDNTYTMDDSTRKTIKDTLGI